MGSKIPPISVPIIRDLILNTPPNTSLIPSLSLLESKASITTVDSSTVEGLSLYYSSYILALILDDDLNEAHHLTQRIDKTLLNDDAVLISTYRLLQSLFSKDYITFHQTIQNAPWGEFIGVLVANVLEKHRKSTLTLLSQAYTTLSPSTASKYLGSNDNSQLILELTEKYGWEYDKSQDLLLAPKNTLNGISGRRDVGAEGEIARLAGLVGYLSEL